MNIHNLPPIELKLFPYDLDFKFDAGTSRGVLKQKRTYLIQLTDGKRTAWGEAGPLKGLSVDDRPTVQEEMTSLLEQWSSAQDFPATLAEVPKWAQERIPDSLPSLRFGMEMAWMDYFNGGKRMIFDTPFYHGQEAIPINGLVWMGSEEFMAQQMEQKLKAGFACIKMKIGAIDYDREMNLLHQLRRQYSANKIVLRVDANGAFAPDEAREVLRDLNRLEVHSIEQPLKAGQWEAMGRLCHQAVTPVALDEELIGLCTQQEQTEMMNEIQPQYIILKPTLVGGIAASLQWIQHADALKAGWWMTSALESNVGLNAIAQFTAHLKVTMPQGLGTGQLYHNNFASPLQIHDGAITYKQETDWEIAVS